MDVTLLDYAPDADSTVRGVMVNCSAWIPTLRGYRGAPGVESTTLPALAAACRGAAVIKKLDSSTRVYAGTATKLYEAGASSWTDRTRTVGGDYTLGATNRWRFAQFGNVSLAAAKTDTLQYSTTGVFENVTGAPKAGIVETAGDANSSFVFLFDTNEATYGDSQSRVWWSARNDYTTWTPSIALGCGTLELLSSPGKIRAARRFGSGIVAYKESAMYVGTWQGDQKLWGFKEVPGNFGAVCQEAVIDVGTPEQPKHIFMGLDDFYMFDGARPVPIGNNRVKETVYSTIQRGKMDQCIALHDRVNSLIYFFYPVADSVNPDKCVVYNYRVDKWGRDDRQIEAGLEYVSAGLTYDDLGTSYGTYADLPDSPYDTAFINVSAPYPAIIDTLHVLKIIRGAAGDSSYTFGDLGDDTQLTLLTRAKPRFFTQPTSSNVINYYRNNLGDSLTLDATTPMLSSRYDVFREARWHRLRFDHTGNVELNMVRLDYEVSGDE